MRSMTIPLIILVQVIIQSAKKVKENYVVLTSTQLRHISIFQKTKSKYLS
jgi:hypothetical protein